MTDTIRWVLNDENPSARYLALRYLMGREASDPQARAARAAIPGWGPARAILDAQWPAGYWVAPGPGYSPRHKATVWQVIFLAALGAPLTSAIARACESVLRHSRLPDGRFTAGKTARGAVACLNGNLLRAMYRLGYDDSRVEDSLEALAEMVRRDRFCCRFNAQHPLPARMDAGLPCLSGAVKALGAFVEAPERCRSTAVTEALQAAVSFLTDGNEAGDHPRLAGADYITARGDAASRWHQFTFPPDDSADLLEALDALGRMDVPSPPGLQHALALIRAKRGADGAWQLERTPENTWVDFGTPGQSNKWVTIRALAVLQRWEEQR